MKALQAMKRTRRIPRVRKPPRKQARAKPARQANRPTAKSRSRKRVSRAKSRRLKRRTRKPRSRVRAAVAKPLRSSIPAVIESGSPALNFPGGVRTGARTRSLCGASADARFPISPSERPSYAKPKPKNPLKRRRSATTPTGTRRSKRWFARKPASYPTARSSPRQPVTSKTSTDEWKSSTASSPDARNSTAESKTSSSRKSRR